MLYMSSVTLMDQTPLSGESDKCKSPWRQKRQDKLPLVTITDEHMMVSNGFEMTVGCGMSGGKMTRIYTLY